MKYLLALVLAMSLVSVACQSRIVAQDGETFADSCHTDADCMGSKGTVGKCGIVPSCKCGGTAPDPAEVERARTELRCAVVFVPCDCTGHMEP